MPSSTTSVESLVARSVILCTQSIADLSLPNPSTSLPPPAPVADCRNDLVSLLALVGKECTALSLAFKPPASVQAVEGTLEKLHGLLIKVAFCVSSCPREGALPKEINWIAQEAFEAVQRLLESSLEGYKAGVGDVKEVKDLRQHNLNLTGAVWEVVERSKTLSADELQAMRKEWQSVLGMLDDCLEEVKEMETSAAEDEGVEDENDDTESEEEDDFRTSHPLNETERARVTAAHMLLRLGRLLLNRLINSTAPPSPLKGFAGPTFLASTQALVQRLSATSDDFALSLEPPQSDVIEVMEDLSEVTKELADAIDRASGGNEAEGKWLRMWRTQMGTAKDKLLNISS